MRIVLILISVLVFSSAFAEGDPLAEAEPKLKDDVTSERYVINLANYNVTGVEVKKAVVWTLLKRRYRLGKVNSTHFRAILVGRSAGVELVIEGNKIKIMGKDDMKPKWLLNIQRDVDFWLTYYSALKREDN